MAEHNEKNEHAHLSYLDLQNRDASVEPPKKNFGFSILLFILGIAAVGGLTALTIINKLPKLVLAAELVVLFSLIGLLIVSVNTKKKVARQFEQNERHPYANVQKKEIEQIFDKIAEEEKKRQKLDAFAAGVDLKKMPTITPAKSGSDEKPTDGEDKADSKSAESDKLDETEEAVITLPDDEESAESDKSKSEESKKSDPSKEAKKENKEEDNEDSADDEDEDEDEEAEENPASKKRSDSEQPPRKKRPPEGSRPRSGDPRSRQQGGQQRSRRPYDPYYEDRYDQYGQPRRRPAPVYYDEYGNPVRPRVLYDEYGNPVRRRPADPYGDPRRQNPQAKRRRPADGAPVNGQKKRPPEQRGATAAAAAAGAAAPKRQSGPVAPVAMAPIKQESNYSDEYIPVAIVDEEDDYVPAPVPRRRRREVEPEPVSTEPYRSQYTEDEVIVTIPDYDEEQDYEYRPAVRNGGAKRRPQPRPEPVSREPYRSQYTEDEVIVTIPDYEDAEQEEAERLAVQRRRQAAAQAIAEEEEAPIVLLPQDEGYDEYMSQKRAEERKAERKASGKTALTIQKLRRKKIRRNSRKYKIFRASVHPLSEYLNSYAAKNR